MTTSILLQAMWWTRGRGTKSSSLLPAMQMHPRAHQHLSPRHQTSHWNPHLNQNHKTWFHSHLNKSQPRNHSLNHFKRKTLNQNWVEADAFKRNHLAHTSEWPRAYPHLMKTLQICKMTYLRMKRTGKWSYP